LQLCILFAARQVTSEELQVTREVYFARLLSKDWIEQMHLMSSHRRGFSSCYSLFWILKTGGGGRKNLASTGLVGDTLKFEMPVI